MPTLSAVVPVLDEARALPSLLASLAGQVDEIVVVDGGSTDGSPALAAAAGARVVASPRGRGPQLHAGALAARGELLWFLHADTGLPAEAGAAVRRAADEGAAWGCFEVRLDSADPRLRLTAAAMGRRARRSGSCTGDMGLWCRRDFYERIGGFAPVAALEDLDFSDRARAAAPCAVLRPALTTSARRWRQHGTTRTVLRMWALRLGWRLGLPAEDLARFYTRRAR